MNARRTWLLAIGALLAAPRALGQQPKAVRIGYVAGDARMANPHRLQAFRDGLRELGYVEGGNLVIEYRWAEGKFERLPALTTDLVRLNVAVIVAVGDPVISAAVRATKTIPIVMTSVGDPVGRGFVASLARPGGNVTGVSNFAVTLVGKWLELLKEIVPSLTRVAILGNAGNSTHRLFWAEARIVAPALGLVLQDVDVRGAGEVAPAFDAIVRAGSGAVVVLPDPLLGLESRHIAELGMKNGLPIMGTFREQAQVGLLYSYGPNLTDNFHRAAVYVDKILKGAKPADLPVEQPTKFESIANLRTAKALGVTLPQPLLLRADTVID